MHLRHKKPINSYRGQGNNDKNEFDDEDFKHQPSPAKKFINPSGEQMFKYSKILAKFIMNTNQFYRQKIKNPRKQKTEIQHILEQAKITRDQSRNYKNSKKVEQPKQKRKIMSKIQNEKLQQKQEKQKQCYQIEPEVKIQKEIQQIDSQKAIQKNVNGKNTPLNSQVSALKTELLTREKIPIVAPQNIMSMYNSNIPMNPYMNPQMFAGMQGVNVNQYMVSYQQMMRMAMLQQMIKNEQFKGMNFNNINPQILAGLVASAQFAKNAYPNYARNNITPPVQPLVKKNAPIFNLTQVFLKKKESIFNFSKQNPNQMAKRSSIHIGIAYHIYLRQLQKKGVNTSNYNETDPTRQSREIKQRQQGSKKSNRTRSSKK